MVDSGSSPYFVLASSSTASPRQPILFARVICFSCSRARISFLSLPSSGDTVDMTARLRPGLSVVVAELNGLDVLSGVVADSWGTYSVSTTLGSGEETWM